VSCRCRRAHVAALRRQPDRHAHELGGREDAAHRLGEEQALALVTISPAKILGIDSRVGSLEPGKDADFVIWSGNPLSTETRVEQTWIDGRRYFDLEEDRQAARAGRARTCAAHPGDPRSHQRSSCAN
jgi:predicted amidohydrolase YtcJ